MLEHIRKTIHSELDRILAEITEEYSQEVDQVISTTEVFENDIVDTGRLLESKQIEVSGDFANGGEKAVEFSWAPQNPDNGYFYAPAVWAGFFAYGKKYIPGRHWPEEAMKRVDPVEAIAQKFQEAGYDAEVTQNNIQNL